MQLSARTPLKPVRAGSAQNAAAAARPARGAARLSSGKGGQVPRVLPGTARAAKARMRANAAGHDAERATSARRAGPQGPAGGQEHQEPCSGWLPPASSPPAPPPLLPPGPCA